VQPGHIFPLQAQDGGVLMRAGHTEAGCDLARMAGLTPAAVICEIMKDDGTMARLPDLEVFAREHGLKIGTIADLIGYRSRNESLVQRVGQRNMATPQGEFDCTVWRDRSGGVHLSLSHGRWVAHRRGAGARARALHRHRHARHRRRRPFVAAGRALQALQAAPHGVAVLLNCSQDADGLLPLLLPDAAASAAPRAQIDLRTYGVGAQILRELGVRRMKLLGSPRRMPSMTGYGLEVTGFVAA
jgi:3,4-dihydroxy 2-butanone 4-phosphate synthase/GTP cyclohydrolase II